MKNYPLLLLLLLLAACQSEPVQNKPEDPSANAYQLPHGTPGAHGIASEQLVKLLDKIDSSGIEFHSLMILRHDTVIAEGWWSPYQSDYKHTMYSLSKSFVSTAIGFAVQEGILSVSDKVISFFPEDLPDSVDEKLADMEVQDLLTMSSGHESGTMPGMFQDPEGNWPRGFLAQPLTYQPGAQFMYNTGATYMLSAILQKQTGETVLDYLTPRLFEPLGIEDMDWEEDPAGVNVGGYGLRVKTRDIAKLGLLYKNKGMFNGRRLLDESWVTTATSALIDSYEGDGDWSQGYGYQFWQCKPDAYRGDGAFGQYCIVVPGKDLVIAITSESKDMQASMDLLWEHLLPFVEDSVITETTAAQSLLDEKLASLSLNRAPLEEFILEVPEVIQLNENELGLAGISLDVSNRKFTLYGSDTLEMAFGWNEWVLNNVRTSIPLGADVDSHMAIRAGTNADGHFVIERQFVETAHHDRFVIDLSKDIPPVTWNESVSLWTEGNVGRTVVLKGENKSQIFPTDN